MKKFLLAAGLIGALAIPGKGLAQAFTTPQDTVKATYPANDGNFHNDITNTSGGDITVQWRVVGNDFPASWKDESVVGICDNLLCRTNAGGLLLSGTTYTSGTIANGTTADFHLQMSMSPASVVPGTYWITAQLKSGTTTKNVTWIVSKFPTGVSTVTRSEDDVVVYPNPARGSVNVVFSSEANVKSVAVYNLIGKMASIYKVNGNSANIPLNDVPAGIYFLRLLDAQGNVVATRKFTHQ